MLKKVLVGLSLVSFLVASPVTVPSYVQTATLDQKVEKSFPNKKIGEIENFRQYADDIMKIVAGKMNIKLDENIPKPQIVTDDEMTQKEFNNLLGYPDDFFDAMCPYYFDSINTILVLKDVTLHSLAHEFVHYFQIKYKKYDFHNNYNDSFEYEAIIIQHWFKDNYMN